MIFKQMANNYSQKANDMTSKNSQSTKDNIGLPVLRKSISEPRLASDIDNRSAGRNHRHSASATPRIVIIKEPSPQRHSVVLEPAPTASKLPRNVNKGDGVSRVTADRSIHMINPRNFSDVMTKNFLRRRANAGDVYSQSETLNADRHHGGLRVTNGKYGSPASSGAGHSDQPRGILKRRDDGSSNDGRFQQLDDGHKMRNDVTTLPEMSWRKSDGSCILAGFHGNKSDLQRGHSSGASSCSWQTYPLSSRPFSTHRGARYLRGNQRVISTNGFIARPSDGYSVNNTNNNNTRIRTRFTTPAQEQSTPLNNNIDRSDPNNVQLPSEDKADVGGKPMTELPHRKRATTTNGFRKNVDGVAEVTLDEEGDYRNFRVRDWLSSLDSTLCQRYARRQMASLREYELSNQKS